MFLFYQIVNTPQMEEETEWSEIRDAYPISYYGVTLKQIITKKSVHHLNIFQANFNVEFFFCLN